MRNGAGNSTTMRMILGPDGPTSGSVTVNGRPPRAHAAPLHEVGGMLDQSRTWYQVRARPGRMQLGGQQGISLSGHFRWGREGRLGHTPDPAPVFPPVITSDDDQGGQPGWHHRAVASTARIPPRIATFG
jgi:hypothetical protein